MSVLHRKIKIDSSTHFARSPGGLWLKGEFDGTYIKLFWKPRFEADGDTITKIDYNGDEIWSKHVSEIEWGDEWLEYVSIEIGDDVVEICGVGNYDLFCKGLMRHTVELVCLGYGDGPADTREMLSDVNSIVEGERYLVVGDHGYIEGLQGGIMRADDDRVVIEGAGVEYNFDISDTELFVSFVVATIPVA